MHNRDIALYFLSQIELFKKITKLLLVTVVYFSFNIIATAQSTQLLGGYTDKLSYVEGQLVTFYTQDNHQEPSYPYVNYGLYNVNNNLMYHILDFNKTSQLSANFNGASEGFNYTPTKYWQVPNTLKSGLYYIGDLSGPNPDHIVPFIIRKYDRLNSEIVIVIPTNTDAAYNGAGQNVSSGFGLYHFDENGIVQPVSFHRPMRNQGYFMSFYKPFLEWYNSVGFPNYYQTNIISDSDMEDFNEIVNAKLLIIIGHSEYWTREARHNFDKFVDNGGNALILSGNTMYWPSRIRQDPSNPSNTQLVCYKNTGDPNESNPLLDTKYTWNDISNLKYSTLSSIGSDSYRGGFQSTGRIKYGNTEYIYPGFNGHKVIKPTSPLFQGTNLTYGSIINVGTDYSPENDGTLISNGLSPNNNLQQNTEPEIDISALGFYRAEIIAYDKLEMLVEGHLPDLQVEDTVYAYTPIMVFQKTCSSGKVINVNSNAWCSQSMIGTNSIVRQVTSNMIALTYWGYNIFSEPSPTSFSIQPSNYSISYEGCNSINILPCGIYPSTPDIFNINSYDKKISIADQVDCNLLSYRISNKGISPILSDVSLKSSNLSTDDPFVIFPNPTNGQFTINYINDDEDSSYSIDIYNVSGKVILSKKISSKSSLFDIENKGLYLVKIASKNLSYIKKIIVN